MNRPTVIVGEYLETNGTDIYIAPGAAPPALGSSRYTIVKSGSETATSRGALQPDGIRYTRPGQALATTVLRDRTYRVELHLIIDGDQGRQLRPGLHRPGRRGDELVRRGPGRARRPVRRHPGDAPGRRRLRHRHRHRSAATSS